MNKIKRITRFIQHCGMTVFYYNQHYKLPDE
jgi:hypothetical protein